MLPQQERQKPLLFFFGIFQISVCRDAPAGDS